MYVLEIECPAGDKDRMIAGLWESGTTGVIETDLPGGRVRLQAYFDSQEDGLAEMYGGAWRREEQRDWVEVARSQWEPILVGSRFFLVPAWRADPAPPGRLRLEMHPGLACGTGWHPATQLALEAMERHVLPGVSVLDVGTGSGILSAAAALLGAGRIFACDIDASAAAVARERFRESGVEAALFIGSVRSVRNASADVVVANINAEALIQLAPEIKRVKRRTAILTGFPHRHLGCVQAEFGGGAAFKKEEWVALVC